MDGEWLKRGAESDIVHHLVYPPRPRKVAAFATIARRAVDVYTATALRNPRPMFPNKRHRAHIPADHIELLHAPLPCKEFLYRQQSWFDDMGMVSASDICFRANDIVLFHRHLW